MALFISTGLLAAVLGRSSIRTTPRASQGDASDLKTEIAALKGNIATLERNFRDAEEQLHHAQKMKAVGELSGGIAHDFNNILTVITAMIKVLTDAVSDKPELAAVAKLIDDAAGRGSDLTQRLLSFSRMQPLQPRATDLNQLIGETTKLFKPTLGAQICVTTNFAADLRPACIDPTQFATALLNLALNARDAMPDGGTLALETGNVDIGDADPKGIAPGRYATLAVQDSGMGIPSSIRHRVFEPFFTTKGEGHGSGLGLAMVCRFIRQSGGHITIDSEEGRGTTMRMYLPCADTAGAL